MINLPNALTLSRIAVIPAFVAAFYVNPAWAPWLTCVLFSAAGFTDLLDGYVARATAQQSAFGRVLDPIADKILVAVALLMLAHVGNIDGLVIIPAIVILCREILVSGLREYLAELRVGLPVSRLAKWKTTIQMVAIGVLLVGDAGWHVLPVRLIGEAGLWTAAVLTLVTGYDYLRSGLRHMRPEAERRRRFRENLRTRGRRRGAPLASSDSHG